MLYMHRHLAFLMKDIFLICAHIRSDTYKLNRCNFEPFYNFEQLFLKFGIIIETLFFLENFYKNVFDPKRGYTGKQHLNRLR